MSGEENNDIPLLNNKKPDWWGPGPTEDELMSMGDRVRNQEPLNNIYESSDFKQGLNRGVVMTYNHILDLLRAEIAQGTYDGDKELLLGLGRAVKVIGEHYK